MSEVKEFIKQIEALLNSWVLEEAEDEYSDLLFLLMGWMLCPNIRGWPDYDNWSSPPRQHSEDARTCRLWKVLNHLQNIIHVHRPSKAATFGDFEMVLSSPRCCGWFICARQESKLAQFFKCA